MCELVDYALVTVCKSTTLSFDGQTWCYGVCATTWPFAKKAVLLWHNNEIIITTMSERKVRVRFAPSPTGPLHIGGVRTALYNYLFARQHGGDMVFRIEDTDSNRFVPGAEDYIIESFKWLGIKFGEGVSFGGDHGPYRQSERRDIYRKYVKQLLDAGKAYIAFDTPRGTDRQARGRSELSVRCPYPHADAQLAGARRRGNTAPD